MTTIPLETDAALGKLARVLDTDPADVAFLAHLDVDTLRRLRDQISDRLHEADAARLDKVMAVSKLVPTSLAAGIGEKWFGPILCARLVGLVEPKRGGQYAKHLSVEFMADITTRTDPRVVGDLIHHLPLRSMQAIATELLVRDDHLTLSHFVGHIPPTVVAAILDAIDDDAAVVRIARYVEDLAHLDPVVALLPDERIVALVHAVHRDDLWVEGLYLFSRLGADQVARIATTLVALDDEVLVEAIEAFERHQLWDQGLELLCHLGNEEMVRIAAVLVRLDDDLITAAVEAASRHDLWEPIVRAAVATGELPEGVARRLAEFVKRLPPDAVERFESTAARLGHPDLLQRLLPQSG